MGKCQKNTTYNWITYTFNTEEISNFSDSPTSSDYNVQISVINGLNIQSLFWDEGTITTTNTTYSDNKSIILFQAKHTVFQVKISGRAMYDKILDFSGKLEGLTLTGGIFDLKSGSYISKTPSSLTHIDFNIDDFYSSSKDTVFNLNLYSTFEGTIPETGIALTLNEITFPTDAYNKANKTSRTINQIRTGSPLIFEFNLAGGTINTQFGKKTNVLFDMSPPMIRVNNEFYAFSNLFF